MAMTATTGPETLNKRQICTRCSAYASTSATASLPSSLWPVPSSTGRRAWGGTSVHRVIFDEPRDSHDISQNQQILTLAYRLHPTEERTNASSERKHQKETIIWLYVTFCSARL